MSFSNPTSAQIATLLRGAHHIAVVGLSENPQRPSYGVARWMQRYGYRVLPVTPRQGEILGEPTFATLDAVVAHLGDAQRIDIVNVFRRPEHVGAIVDDCIRLAIPALWLQLDVIDEGAALRARAAGLFVVMDRCIYRDRAALND